MNHSFGKMTNFVQRLAVSSCSWPQKELEDVLALAGETGFDQFELFTEWAASRVDPRGDIGALRAAGARHGIAFCALHLPTARFGPADDGRFEVWLEQALPAIRLAAGVGAPIVLFKADSVPAYIRASRAVLDECAAQGLTAVITNHKGTAIERPEQAQQVLEAVNDARLKTLLEVGHYHAVGVPWREAAALLGDTVAHVHVKDQVGAQSVPFGQGEIDLQGLYQHLQDRNYAGFCVLEMEVRDAENTTTYLQQAREAIADRLSQEVMA